MNWLRKNYGWIIALILIIAVVVGPIWIAMDAIVPPDQEEMEEYFQEDKEDLALAVEYLCGMDYGYISIDQSKLEDGVMFTGAGTQYQTIENTSALEVLERLLGWGGYNCITKRDQTIVFEKWDFTEMDRGIAYSVREGNRPVVQYLIKAEPLSESGWYYYEADYGEYRNLHELW